MNIPAVLGDNGNSRCERNGSFTRNGKKAPLERKTSDVAFGHQVYFMGDFFSIVVVEMINKRD